MAVSALGVAQELHSRGLQVFPAGRRSKAPTVDWKQWQSKAVTDTQLEEWFNGKTDDKINFWVLCGSASGVICLDCDNAAALEYWQKALGDAIELTTCVRTGKGHHYWFKLDEGVHCRTWAVNEPGGRAFEVRGERTGTIVPPSTHPTGKQYTWVRGLDALQPAPPALLGPSAGGGARHRGGDTAQSRHLLSGLLREPPNGPDSGRNIWLSRVAGHYAKWIPHRDAFEATLEAVNASLPTPLPPEEVGKMAESIWNAEHEDAGQQEPADENGWLIGHSNRLWTPVRQKDGSATLMPFANFDMKCLGIIEDEEGHRSYSVEVRTEGRRVQDLLEYGVLGVFQRITVWLAGHGVNVLPPPGDHRGNLMSRLQRYLESQNAPLAKAAPYLGWMENAEGDGAVDSGGFIIHEGVLRGDGLHEFTQVRPHPKLRGWAPYAYGFVSEEEARSVLNEVLTFQEETLTSVFAAWWSAVWLKGQTAFGTSLFPYVALEAPSESGKTRGFFSLMMQLNGNRMGHGEATTAALRDQVGAHRNGIVWIDDLNDLATVTEILRQATSEGVRTKKGQDRFSQESVRLVAPIVVSGESMGTILAEKAQRDRAVRLNAHSPIGRRSLRGDYPQWDDVEDLLRRYDRDLTRVAGTLGQMALASSGLASEVRRLRGSAGRHNDKVGILRVGARILARLTGDERHVEIVDKWCGRQEDLGAENTLTMQYLPILWMDKMFPKSAKGFPPVFVREGRVFFNTEKVAEEWRKIRRYDFSERKSLASAESIRSQARELGISGSQRFSILGSRSRGETDVQARYAEVPAEVSASIINRAGLYSKEYKNGSTAAAQAESQETAGVNIPGKDPLDIPLKTETFTDVLTTAPEPPAEPSEGQVPNWESQWDEQW